jgi:hypothetical protein
VVIGTDSPTLPVHMVDVAFQTLSSVDVVLGPTRDGGYYLVGAARRVPPIFDTIEWSTNRVFSQTVGRLQQAGLAWEQLPPWYDVDEPCDLLRLRDDLTTSCATDRTFESLRNAVCEITSAGKLPEGC